MLKKKGSQSIEVKNAIKTHFHDFSNNRQLAEFLQINIGTVRRICYELDLNRLELEYFTPEQVNYLISNFQMIGDCELAEVFQQQWPKKKGWTKKHIEKKRKYLGLKRTQKQIQLIHHRNVKNGRFAICPVKAWNKRGRSPDGEIRYWTQKDTGKKYPVIKFNGSFRHWGRWAWEQAFGKIPPKYNVVFKDNDPYNLKIENLLLLSNAELAQRNAEKSSKGLSDNYISGILSPHDVELRQVLKSNTTLIDLKRKQLTLNRIIYEQEKL
ncbi:HNH endonuclease signature motif containing protein [Chitinophaga niabensis]|uniref:HNH endonuclease n=1 Tax=Chitinophaga niabensis TaxID=536979 RepID=A0A1N6KC59_9BACT|nr:HNH endonuclease signature motif containing protein [Chitinophaga niabensis]SIO53916.1 HNH endonuclease [Chitinophaga niabensis]